jgi:chlorobactene glucosyltransferase
MVPVGVAVVLLLAAYVVSLAVLLRATPVLAPAPPVGGEPAALVSVIIPARDEEASIGACLASVLAQDHPPLEVIVVDDGSRDATAEVISAAAARDPRVRVLTGGALPPGWGGKSFAVHQGAAVARGSWLLFLDADVRLEPFALGAAVGWARRHGRQLLSLWPRHELESVPERLVQSVVLAMYFFGEFYHRLRRPWSLTSGRASGAFILVDRAAYAAVGGHEAVRGSIIEDAELSLLVRRHGFATASLHGARAARVRMYASLAEIWDGWSKNTFVGMRHGYLETFAAIVVVGLVCVAPGALGVAALAGLGSGWTWLQGLAIAAWSLLGVSRLLLRDLVPVPWWYLFGYPVGGMVVVGILLNSAYRHTVGGGVAWKGRHYAPAPERRGS